MRPLIIFIAYLLAPFFAISQGSFLPAEADLSFPRSIIEASEIEDVRNTLSDPAKSTLYNSIYNYSNNNIPDDNTSDEARRIRSQIAREAAFVVLMNKKIYNDIIEILPEEDREALTFKVLSILNNLNTEVTFQSGWSFYYTWQFRSKELIHALIAYDLLKGAGVADNLLATAKSKLQIFAGNLYLRSTALYPSPVAGFPDIDFYFYNTNNHGVMVSSALGLAGIVLGDCESLDPNYQPINWIQAGMWNLDNLLWRVDGLLPRVSEPGVVAGYAEGPNYFAYGFDNAFPFIRAMWNFLPDQSSSYVFNGISRTIQNPWYDDNYHNLYKWMILLRMPDGKSPVIHDSSASFGTNATALSGNSAYDIEGAAITNNSIWGRSQYLSTNTQPSEYQESMFQALPDAGSLIFRSTYNDPEGIYMHQIGKHGISLYGAKAHHQADAMSFQLYYNNHIFAIDEGYVGAPYRDFVNKATDHNLILVNGQGPASPTTEFVSNDNEVYIENYFDLESLDYGELAGGWAGAQITRKTLFIDNEYFLMWDFMESEEPKVYQYQLHCSGLKTNEASASTGTVHLDSEAHRAILSKDDHQVLIHTEVSNNSAAVYTLGLDSVYNGNSTFFHNKLLVTTTPTSSTEFTSVLFPFSSEMPTVQHIESNTNGKALLIERATSTDFVFTTGENSLDTISYSTITLPETELITNASSCFLSIDESSSLQNVFIAQGDTLFLNGKEVLTLDHKSHLALEFKADQQITGYINANAVLHLASDTSLMVLDGEIADIFYDPIKKEAIVYFEEATYFTLAPGAATVFTSSSSIDPIKFHFSAYPNPSNGVSILEIKCNLADELILSIIDNKGSLLQSQKVSVLPGHSNVQIDLTGLPKGVYTLSLSGKTMSDAILISHF